MTADANLIGVDLRNTEASFDEALLSSARLLQSMVKARQNPNVAPATAQAAINRLVRSQQHLIAGQSDILRVHAELSKLAVETGNADTGECPEHIIFGAEADEEVREIA